MRKKQNERMQENVLGWIVKPLLDWYEQAARALPWRENATPYKVWISEIMLQQTRVETVVPYFERFVSRLPDVNALAEVCEEELLKLWEGLGYYSRAKNLKKAAQKIQTVFAGEIPQSYDALLSLPGIGPYTAGAILSIAFGQPKSAVDANVLRVVARLCASEADVTNLSVKQDISEMLDAIMPHSRCGDFTQALMELGALVCLSNAEPKCSECPLRMACEAHRLESPRQFPVKTPKAERRIEDRVVFVMIQGGRCALRKRSDQGLLAGLWELPNEQGVSTADEAKKYAAHCGVTVKEVLPLPQAKHIFTHVEWHLSGWLIQCVDKENSASFVWADRAQIKGQYAIASAFKSYVEQALRYME